ncbi:MAG: hypothetical protein IJZ85_12655 [Lachnospiraceae bacterium]|nr:hypothetical protein [Lachnospiraceae bacterium]
MKRYLCPVCDQELTARSYCSTCRKIVKKPVVYDGVLPNEDTGNYLLNHQDLHPDRACVEPNRERVCETSQEKHQDARFTQQNRTVSQGRVTPENRTQRSAASSGTVYQQYRGEQSTAPGSQIWRSGSSGSTYKGRTSSTGSSSRKGKKGCRSGCLTVFIVLWLISFLGGLLGDVLESIDVDSWFEEEYIPDIEVESISEEVYPDTPEQDESVTADIDEDGYVELDYDKLLAIGERCDGYWHYSLSGDLVYEELMIFAESEMGLTMTEQSDYMINEAETPEDGGYTYYDYCRYWDWADGYFAVGSDSVTGDTHYVYAYSNNADQAIEIVLEAFSIVEDADSVGTMRTSLYNAIDQKDITEGYFFDMGNSSVWIYLDSEEGYYMVEVYPVTE